jgi:adenosylmethionine-8-amino-7-oxononanoate aminotransferase
LIIFFIHLIADEIMTGLGRTGKMLACHHADIEPDFICLSKNLTSGWLPMSEVLTSTKIYDLFYGDYNNAFLHSHTYSGNALAAAIALECFNILEENPIYQKAFCLRPLMEDVAEQTGRLKNIRSIGAIVAADLILDESKEKQRYGYQVFQEAVKRGALLRPLGNTIYWLPPLTIEYETLIRLKDITIESINTVFYRPCIRS